MLGVFADDNNKFDRQVSATVRSKGQAFLKWIFVLHCLLVFFKSVLKVLPLGFKCLNGPAPT